jgi:hypothetical protein
VLLCGVAWAEDPTPAPADDSATEAPAVQPSVGSWIIGGTLLEGNAGTPAKPAAKPVAKPRPAVVRTSNTPSSGSGTAVSTEATALPFTGNRADALVPVGITLLVGGVVLTLAGRPRRLAA